jgi:uncharacterized radical SAM superfamily Fe-S cluster-containing enzyme
MSNSEYNRKSICPKCFKEINSKFIEENKKIFLRKRCPEHGWFKVKISSDADYFNELLNIEMPVPKRVAPELVVLPVTHACNLHCPICYVNTHAKVDKIPLEKIKNQIDELSRQRVQRINIFGGEPTVRPDLNKIIFYIKEKKILPVLFTNGIKLTDMRYLKELKDCGLQRVFIQFDGFKSSAYNKLRGKDILDYKMMALENLNKLRIATVLEVTISSGVNEDQIWPIIKYAAKNRFIKAVSFRSYSYLGSKPDKVHSIDAQKMIQIMEKDSGHIKCKDVLEFQKFFLRFCAAGGQPNCIYMNFFAVDRELNPLNRYFNFESYKAKNGLLGLARLFRLSAFLFYIKIATSIPKLLGGIHLEDLSDEILPITFETQCDSYSYDIDIAKHCRGHDMIEGMIMLTGEANIYREKNL